MEEYLYTLKAHRDSDELHLFRSGRNAKRDCLVERESVCRKMNFEEGNQSEFMCRDEQYAREVAACFGRRVCGTCISTLYANIEP